jgi:hypothetical protein
VIGPNRLTTAHSRSYRQRRKLDQGGMATAYLDFATASPVTALAAHGKPRP